MKTPTPRIYGTPEHGILRDEGKTVLSGIQYKKVVTTVWHLTQGCGYWLDLELIQLEEDSFLYD